MGTSRFRKDTLSSSLNIRSSTALPLSSVSTGSGALSKLKWSLLNHSHMNVLLMDEYKTAQHHRPFQIKIQGSARESPDHTVDDYFDDYEETYEQNEQFQTRNASETILGNRQYLRLRTDIQTKKVMLS